MLVEQFLEQSAAKSPDKIALICGDRRLTYRQLDDECNRVAALLREHGVARGDRVVICLDNSVETVIAVFAALKAGAVFVVVPSAVKADKLAFLIRDARAIALVSDRRKLGSISKVLAESAHLKAVISVGGQPLADAAAPQMFLAFEQQPSNAEPAASPCIDMDLAALIYTSGTTGQPKGVMLSHLNVVTAADSIATYLRNTAADIVLSVLPLSYSYGLCQLFVTFKTGGTLILERSLAYPHAVLETLVRERTTGFPLVPTISAILLQLDLSRYDFSSLRYITNAAAAFPTRHITELRRRLPHVAIYAMYGQTECMRASYLPPDEIDIKPDSVGKGMPNTEVYIVDESGRRVTSGVGELVIRGSHVMKGYWERPEETARALKPGPLPGERVLHSGDLFRMDEHGYLYFVSRTDDIIKTRGEKVSPKDIENTLFEMPEVEQAAVFGIDDEVLGQSIRAVVTLKAGTVLTEQEVLRHCASRLEDFMIPKAVEVRASIPVTANGKIDKRALRRAVEVSR